MIWVRRIFWMGLATCLIAYPVAFLALCAFVSFYEPPGALPAPATIVILSAGQRLDGTMGPNTTDRVNAGLSVYDPGDRVLVTGGRLRAHPDAIAQAMAHALRAHGIEPLVEPNAQSTYDNANFSAEILSDLPRYPVILVTNRFHLPRAWLYFRNAGIDDVTLFPAETARRHWAKFHWRTLAVETVKIFDAAWTSLSDGAR